MLRRSPPSFCKGCGRPVVPVAIKDFDRYDGRTGEPLKPKITLTHVCVSIFDKRPEFDRQRFASRGFTTTHCYRPDKPSTRLHRVYEARRADLPD